MNTETTLTKLEPAGNMSPAGLLEKAVSSGVSVEIIERLMGLEERWRENQARRAFNAAMADFRQNIPPIVKTQSANFGTGKTNYKYEDLAEITETLTPALAKFGLSFRWRTEPGDPVKVTCLISHRDGHTEECALSAPRDTSGSKNAIQSLGSAITYLQRYTLKAALGVAASQDDDGHGAGAPVRQERPVTRQEPPASAPKAPPSANKLRERMLVNLQSFGDRLHEYTLDVLGCNPEDWPEENLPRTKEELASLQSEIEEFLARKDGLAPVSPVAPVKPETVSDQTKVSTVVDNSDWFWDVVIVVPRAGQKRDEYMKNPDTIGSLYKAMKAGDKQAGARLFGIASHYQPEERVGADGNLIQPTEHEINCRKGLDAFAEWQKAKH